MALSVFAIALVGVGGYVAAERGRSCDHERPAFDGIAGLT